MEFDCFNECFVECHWFTYLNFLLECCILFERYLLIQNVIRSLLNQLPFELLVCLLIGNCSRFQTSISSIEIRTTYWVLKEMSWRRLERAKIDGWWSIEWLIGYWLVYSDTWAHNLWLAIVILFYNIMITILKTTSLV